MYENFPLRLDIVTHLSKIVSFRFPWWDLPASQNVILLCSIRPNVYANFRTDHFRSLSQSDGVDCHHGSDAFPYCGDMGITLAAKGMPRMLHTPRWLFAGLAASSHYFPTKMGRVAGRLVRWGLHGAPFRARAGRFAPRPPPRSLLALSSRRRRASCATHPPTMAANAMPRARMAEEPGGPSRSPRRSGQACRQARRWGRPVRTGRRLRGGRRCGVGAETTASSPKRAIDNHSH